MKLRHLIDWFKGRTFHAKLETKIAELETRAMKSANNDRLWYKLAELNEMAMDDEAAIFAYTRGIEINRESKRHARALSALVRITRLAPNDAARQLDLAHTLEALDRRRDAAEAYHAAAKTMERQGASNEATKLRRHAEALKYAPRSLMEQDAPSIEDSGFLEEDCTIILSTSALRALSSTI